MPNTPPAVCSVEVSRSTEGAVYYDPYDVAINADPYPAFRRLREEAPLYYNEQHDFYALSRFEDVERGFVDHHTFSSVHGGVLEAIKAGYRAPNGVFIMEDPPVHTAHRGVLARVFTPKKMNALEPQIRAYCAEVLDPLVGNERFDFVADLGAKMPMRVIGMLLGIPEEDQEAIRRQADERIRREPGKPHRYRANHFTDDEFFGDYIDWRAEHPSDDLMTELLLVEFEDETGTVRRLTRGEILTFVKVLASAGNETTNRLIGWSGKVLGEHPDQRRELAADRSLIPNAIEELLRFEPPSINGRALRRSGRRALRHDGAGRECDDAAPRRGEPRPSGVPTRRRRVRHPPRHRPSPHLRVRHPLLPRRRARPPRGPHRARRGSRPVS